MTPPLYRRAGEPDATTLSRLGRATFRETFGHLYPAEDLAEYLDRAYDPEETRHTLGDPSWASWIVESPAGQPLGFATAGPCSLPHPAVSGASLELKRFYSAALTAPSDGRQRRVRAKRGRFAFPKL